MGRASYTAYNANILTVTVETNTPRGGNAGYGGLTVLELKDESGTEIEAKITPDGVRVELRGDTECQTLIECLRFAAEELERQVRENKKGRDDAT